MAKLCDKSNDCDGYEEGQCWLIDCYERKDENITRGKRLIGSSELSCSVTKTPNLKPSAELAGSLTSLAEVKTALKDFINSRELEDGEVCNECIDIVNNWVDAFFDNTKTQ